MAPTGISGGRVYDSKNPEDTVLDRENYKGVDPIYQNYANDTDEPQVTPEDEEGARNNATKFGGDPELIAKTPVAGVETAKEEDEVTPAPKTPGSPSGTTQRQAKTADKAPDTSGKEPEKDPKASSAPAEKL